MPNSSFNNESKLHTTCTEQEQMPPLYGWDFDTNIDSVPPYSFGGNNNLVPFSTQQARPGGEYTPQHMQKALIDDITDLQMRSAEYSGLPNGLQCLAEMNPSQIAFPHVPFPLALCPVFDDYFLGLGTKNELVVGTVSKVWRERPDMHGQILEHYEALLRPHTPISTRPVTQPAKNAWAPGPLAMAPSGLDTAMDGQLRVFEREPDQIKNVGHPGLLYGLDVTVASDRIAEAGTDTDISLNRDLDLTANLEEILTPAQTANVGPATRSVADVHRNPGNHRVASISASPLGCSASIKALNSDMQAFIQENHALITLAVGLNTVTTPVTSTSTALTSPPSPPRKRVRRNGRVANPPSNFETEVYEGNAKYRTVLADTYPYITDFLTAADARQFFQSPHGYKVLDLTDDDWQAVKPRLQDYAEQLHAAIQVPGLPSLPEKMTDKLEKRWPRADPEYLQRLSAAFVRQQERGMIEIKEFFSTNEKRKVVRAACVLAVDAVLTLHQFGIPPKLAEEILNTKKPRHSHLDDSICSSRMNRLIDVVRDYKLVSLDVLQMKNLGRIAYDPTWAWSEKFD